jgi:chromosome segregation ATPase
MIEVQEELLFLKRKANEKELKLQQDDKILSLEQELAWIREETMKSREEIDNQELLISDLKQENQELQDDARFLKDQLQECKASK